MFEVTENVGCMGGGIFLHEESSLIINGLGTETILRGNIVPKMACRTLALEAEFFFNIGGGGLLAWHRKDTVEVSKGGLLTVKDNFAHGDGGGMLLYFGTRTNLRFRISITICPLEFRAKTEHRVKTKIMYLWRDPN